MQVKQISDNEIYLLIKYIRSVLWRAAKCLSYIEEARCLKVKLVDASRNQYVVEERHILLYLYNMLLPIHIAIIT